MLLNFNIPEKISYTCLKKLDSWCDHFLQAARSPAVKSLSDLLGNKTQKNRLLHSSGARPVK